MRNENQILLYDDYCPLCTWYSGLFVKYGFLKDENRLPFSKANEQILATIDIEKGKNEIPLFDASNKKTLYGIDSLLEILGWKCSLIKTTGNLSPVKWFLKKLYKLVSFNRKVVVAKKCGKGQFDCSPEFNFRYRILFMLICLPFNSLMLYPYHESIFSHLSFYHLTSSQLETSHFIFVMTNILLALSLERKLLIEYLGQVNMLALISILSLLPLMIIARFIDLNQWVVFFYLAAVTSYIVKEYFRRMRYAGIFSAHMKVIVVNLFCLAGYLAYVFH